LFRTWSIGAVVEFEERGAWVVVLGSFLKGVVKWMSVVERLSFEKAWVNRLIQAAKDSGAAIPSGTLKV
jgi:hypothetical protein